MSKASSIQNLSEVTRDALIKRLRDSNYGGIDENLDWLKEQGHTDISRSALGRFVIRLSSVEASNGVLAAQIKILGRRPIKLKESAADRAFQISKRLAEISREQEALIKEFVQMAAHAAAKAKPQAQKLP